MKINKVTVIVYYKYNNYNDIFEKSECNEVLYLNQSYTEQERNEIIDKRIKQVYLTKCRKLLCYYIDRIDEIEVL